MAGGQFVGSTNLNYVKAVMNWSYSYDTYSDSCHVTVTFYARWNDSGTGNISGNGNFEIIIDDANSTHYGYVTVGYGLGDVKIFAFSHDVKMLGATTKQIKLQLKGGLISGKSWVSTTCGLLLTLDKNADKPPEPSTATVTTSVPADGLSRCYVYITKKISVASYKIVWRLGAKSYTNYYGDIAQADYLIPADWADVIGGASATAYVDLTTYNGSDYTEEVSPTLTYEFTVTVPASAAPQVQAGWVDIEPDNTGTNAPAGMYVQGFSKLKATFDASKVTAPSGATISGYRLDYMGQQYGAPYITDVLRQTGLQIATPVVTDSRGRTASANIAFTIEAYANPTLSKPQAYRSSADGSASAVGTNICVNAIAVFSSLQGKNHGTLQAQWKVAGGEYGQAIPMQSGVNLIISNINRYTSYYVLITLTDRMGSKATSEILVPAASAPEQGTEPDFRGFAIKDGGLGAAFGTTPKDEGWLVVHYSEGLALTTGRKLKIGNTEIDEEQLKALLGML